MTAFRIPGSVLPVLAAIAALESCACPIASVALPAGAAIRPGAGPVPLPSVVFATNREPIEGQPSPNLCDHSFFGPDRSDRVLRGIAHVDAAVRDGALFPELAAAEASSDRALSEILLEACDATPADAVLYVHGFHTTFAESVASASLVGAFLGGGVLPVAFSWPAGIDTLWIGSAYMAERESADLSVPRFNRVLQDLRAASCIRRVHLIGHSTGAWLLCRGLEDLVRDGSLHGEGLAPIGEIVLASADIDMDVFRERFLPAAAGIAATRITAYINSRDRVLGLSSLLRARVALRLGEAPLRDLRQVSGIAPVEYVDITSLGGMPNLGHSYLLATRRISEDLVLVLRGTPPSRRQLLPGPFPGSYTLEGGERDGKDTDNLGTRGTVRGRRPPPQHR